MPWDRIHGELWFKSQAVVRKQSPPTASFSSKLEPDPVPKGYCFRFYKAWKFNLAVLTSIHALNVMAPTQ